MNETNRTGRSRPASVKAPTRPWAFLTSHAAVLLHLADNPSATMREIAAVLELTERTTASVIADLREAGYVKVERRQNRNHYTVRKRMPLRRPGYANLRVGDLLALLAGVTKTRQRRS